MNITKRMNSMEGKNSQIDFNKLDRIVKALGEVAGIIDQLCTVKYGMVAGFARANGVVG
ncbi:hypothetical protein [Pinibacter aurantiacus]|uniref:Uncharacterized protein n=1 Tax=Pinibacter aurantiacus TaxID=2851599 RepID=A0A9E2W3K3_9BACT|nr:hypothetical protein [Pinibacter aurantiacus]MBV4356358.1 hypothetical protein [Pinibacter aurantiacus]